LADSKKAAGGRRNVRGRAIISREKLKSKLKFFRSLRFRIMIILILIGIVPSVIAATVVVRGYVDRAVSLRSINVKNQCDILCNTLVTEKYVSNTNNDVINSELALLSNIYSGRIVIVDSDYKVVKDTYDLDTGKTSVSRDIISCANGNGGTTLYDSDNNYIQIVVPIQDPDTKVIEGVMLASVSTNEIDQNVRILENEGLLVIIIISLLVFIIGYFLAGILVKPFRTVTRAIEDVTDGYEEERISVPDYTETEQITDAFNKMLTRVKTVDNSRNEFVSNVSHELKTPMTSMKVLADSLNSQENVPVEVYREFMQDLSAEIDRENKIIQDLLSMVRMDRKASTLEIAKVDIGAMLEQTIKRLQPIAAKRNIELLLDSNSTVTAEVDEIKLSLAFSNLIENAIKYNLDGGWVRVTLKADHKFFYVSVSDSGIGIPEDEQEHIFERFYRVDKSHSTEIEGTGLGLAITRRAVLLHRGSIKVTSKLKEGTTFAVRIPLAHQSVGGGQ
jgi:signal transduction histidine kinase